MERWALPWNSFPLRPSPERREERWVWWDFWETAGGKRGEGEHSKVWARERLMEAKQGWCRGVPQAWPSGR